MESSKEGGDNDISEQEKEAPRGGKTQRKKKERRRKKVARLTQKSIAALDRAMQTQGRRHDYWAGTENRAKATLGAKQCITSSPKKCGRA